MKKNIILAVLIIMCSSCSTEDDVNIESEILGQWDLVKMTVPFEGTELTEAEMEWQEFYILKEDGTFTKTRLRDGETNVVEGTYILHNAPYGNLGDAHVSMVYKSQNNLIGTCYGDELQEKLYFESNKRMVNTWIQCDGLGMEYVKTKN